MKFGDIFSFIEIIGQSFRSAIIIYAISFVFFFPFMVLTYQKMGVTQAYTISGLASIIPGAIITGIFYVKKTWNGGINAIILIAISFAVIMFFSSLVDFRWFQVMFYLNYIELLGIELLFFSLSGIGLFAGFNIRKLIGK